MSQYRRPPLLGEALVVVALVSLYAQVRGQAGLRRDAAFAHGRQVMNVERTFGLDWETAANDYLTRHPLLAEVVCWWYQLAHLSVTFSVLACCYLAWPTGYRRARNALVLTNVAGLLVFFAWPVAPPRLLPGGGYTDTVLATLGDGAVSAPNQYGAMPSLHLAWATWVAFTVCALVKAKGLSPWLRVPAIVYPVITSVAVVTTANHYVLDVFAGVAVAGVAVGLAGAPAGSRVPVRSTAADGRPAAAAATP